MSPGSIDTPGQIAALKEAGAAGFTIGTAALDGKYPADGTDVPSQLATIIRDVARLNRHISPFHKDNLTRAFGRFSDSWPPRSPQASIICRSSWRSSKARPAGISTARRTRSSSSTRAGC
jgi:ribosomal protein S15P/S13E